MFDFGWVDVDAVHDHHLVGTTQIDQLAIGRNRSQVSRIEPFLLKGGLGRSLIIQVSMDHPWASDADMSCDATWGDGPIAVNDFDAYARPRIPDGSWAARKYLWTGNADQACFVRGISHIQSLTNFLKYPPSQAFAHGAGTYQEHTYLTEGLHGVFGNAREQAFEMKNSGTDYCHAQILADCHGIEPPRLN